MFLICGLGNPGVSYKNTRHNVGFHLADSIITHFNLDKIKEDKILACAAVRLTINRASLISSRRFPLYIKNLLSFFFIFK